VIRTHTLTKDYALGPIAVPVLKGIDLEVDEGDMLAITGASGSGKSTLMNILGMLDRPSSGEYHFAGHDVFAEEDDGLSAIRNARIGFVFQSYHLLSRHTALDNVALPLLYRGLERRERRRRAGEALDKVGLAERSRHRPNELSGGQQQRVAIARALVGAPSLVLADEPTGALDTRVGGEIMDLFLSLNERDGITVIIITHDPDVAAACRRQVTIADGRLVQDSAGPQPRRQRVAAAAAGEEQG
jgi:putative ABC transport system ATP-binding protein